MRSLLALAILCSCKEPAPPGELPPAPIAPATSTPKPQLPPWRGNRALPRLPDDAAKNASYLAAVDAWRTATTAYTAGDATGAAERFLASAEALNGGDSEAIARTFAAGRCLAYENAARAYAAAKQFDRAKEKLSAAAESDAACGHSIAAALDRIKDD